MAQVDVSRIASNIGALNALNSLRDVNTKLATHQTRLATGKRINSAGDDPAGMTIATKLNARSEGLKTALNNIGDAKNLLSVAESGLTKINDILTNMRTLAQQGVSDTLGTEERDAIKNQLKEYEAQISDTIKQTKWNGTDLISNSSNLTFQTGADSSDTTGFTAINLVTVTGSSNGLDLSVALDSTSGSSFGSYMGKVDTAMSTVSKKLSDVGSLINKMGFKEDQLAVSQVNVESAYNRIMNADMAQEQLEATKFSILQQTGITMLSQANSAPQGILSLFR